MKDKPILSYSSSNILILRSPTNLHLNTRIHICWKCIEIIEGLSWLMDLYQSFRSIFVRAEVYTIQCYINTFVSELWQICGFLPRFLVGSVLLISLYFVCFVCLLSVSLEYPFWIATTDSSNVFFWDEQIILYKIVSFWNIQNSS